MVISLHFRVMECFYKETDMDKKLTNEFILQQLLGITSILDMSDEAGRFVSMF